MVVQSSVLDLVNAPRAVCAWPFSILKSERILKRNPNKHRDHSILSQGWQMLHKSQQGFSCFHAHSKSVTIDCHVLKLRVSIAGLPCSSAPGPSHLMLLPIATCLSRLTKPPNLRSSSQFLEPTGAGRRTPTKSHYLVIWRSAYRVRLVTANPLCKPKVSYLQISLDVQEQVFWFQVAVHDPLGM